MKASILTAVLFITFFAKGQSPEADQMLGSYGINSQTLSYFFSDATSNFDYNFESNDLQNNEVTSFSYDHKKGIGERWKLKSINGNSPSKKELKAFDKIYNADKEFKGAQIDEASFQVLQGDQHYDIVSFNFNENTLPSAYVYLEKCTGKIYLNKRTQRFEKIHFENNENLKVNGVNAEELTYILIFQLNQNTKNYEVYQSNLEILAKGSANKTSISTKIQQLN
ncbi:MAG: hypothetical protein N4A46_08125 [Schleiferiaceae bacterium]|jgi:hypothetical protein|nr:hypothetical protein [Schleiferiaceae bacterium]